MIYLFIPRIVLIYNRLSESVQILLGRAFNKNANYFSYFSNQLFSLLFRYIKVSLIRVKKNIELFQRFSLKILNFAREK